MARDDERKRKGQNEDDYDREKEKDVMLKVREICKRKRGGVKKRSVLKIYNPLWDLFNIIINIIMIKILTISAKTGKTILATATLAVNSVTDSAKRQTMNNITIEFMNLRPSKVCPSFTDNPDEVLPAAMANPPPRTRIRLQCIFS